MTVNRFREKALELKDKTLCWIGDHVDRFDDTERGARFFDAADRVCMRIEDNPTVMRLAERFGAVPYSTPIPRVSHWRDEIDPLTSRDLGCHATTGLERAI